MIKCSTIFQQYTFETINISFGDFTDQRNGLTTLPRLPVRVGTPLKVAHASFRKNTYRNTCYFEQFPFSVFKIDITKYIMFKYNHSVRQTKRKALAWLQWTVDIRAVVCYIKEYELYCHFPQRGGGNRSKSKRRTSSEVKMVNISELIFARFEDALMHDVHPDGGKPNTNNLDD